MIELIFLFIVIPRRMTRLARERNRSALAWSLGAIGVWLGVECVVGLVFGIGMAIVGGLSGRPRVAEGYLTLAYVLALVAALIGAELMVRRLRGLPPLPAT